MPQGPHLIFDKSSLESLSVDESALLDNFYTCNITRLLRRVSGWDGAKLGDLRDY
jgi:hypothetical protein